MTETPDKEDISVPMTDDGIPFIVNGRRLSDVEIQALREAKLRREQDQAASQPKELGGANRTTEPTRYGDWEKAGRAVDFS